MVQWSLAPKWPILVHFCGMDHQKSNFVLILAPFLSEAVEANQCNFFENWLMRHKWATLVNMQLEIYFQNSHSWGFLGWATTWGNGRVSQSFWVLENNSVVLKSLFCGIVWCEIQSYRKATCNFVVLTFIKKKNLLHQGSNQGPSDQKPDALPDELLRLCWQKA